MLGMSTHGTRPITLVEPFLHILRRQLQLAELNPQRERRPHFDPFSVRLFLLLVFFPSSFLGPSRLIVFVFRLSQVVSLGWWICLARSWSRGLKSERRRLKLLVPRPVSCISVPDARWRDWRLLVLGYGLGQLHRQGTFTSPIFEIIHWLTHQPPSARHVL